MVFEMTIIAKILYIGFVKDLVFPGKFVCECFKPYLKLHFKHLFSEMQKLVEKLGKSRKLGKVEKLVN